MLLFNEGTECVGMLMAFERDVSEALNFDESFTFNRGKDLVVYDRTVPLNKQEAP